MDLKDYLRVIRRRVLEFVSVVAIVIIVWVLKSVKEEQLYAAHARVTVRAEDYSKTSDNKLQYLRNIKDFSEQLSSDNKNRGELNQRVAKKIYKKMGIAIKANNEGIKKFVENQNEDETDDSTEKLDFIVQEVIRSGHGDEFNKIQDLSKNKKTISSNVLNYIRAYQDMVEHKILIQDYKDDSDSKKEVKHKNACINYIAEACKKVGLNNGDKTTNSLLIGVVTNSMHLSQLVVNEVAFEVMERFNDKQSELNKTRAEQINYFYKDGLTSYKDRLERDVLEISQQFYEKYVISLLNDDVLGMDRNIQAFKKWIKSQNPSVSGESNPKKKKYYDEVYGKLLLVKDEELFDKFYSIDLIRKSEKEKAKLRSRLKYVKTSNNAVDTFEFLEQAQKELDAVQRQIESYSNQIDTLEKSIQLMELKLSELTVYQRKLIEMQNESYLATKKQLIAEELLIKDLEEKYTPEHPDVILQKKQIQNYKDILTKMEEDQVAKRFLTHDVEKREMEVEIRFNNEKLNELHEIQKQKLANIDRLQEREETIKGLHVERNAIKENIQEYKNELNTLSKEISINKIIDVSDPSLAGKKIDKKYQIGTTFYLTILIGIVIAVFVVYIHEYLDTSIKTEHDVRRHLNLPVLAMVGKARKEVILTQLPSKDPFAEDFNTAATLVKSAAQDLNLKSFLVTSTVPQEGKTTICVDIAIALARKGLRIIIVDADLRIPTVHEVLEVDNTTGLSSLLEGSHSDVNGEMGIEQYLKPTAVDNLRVLTSGPIPGDPINLLESVRMKALIEELKDNCDYLIMDTPPIYNVGDTLTIAGMVDATLFVVGSERVQQDQVTWAKHLLTNVNANILGVFLNMVRVTGSSYYYYYNGYKSYRSRD